MTKLRNRLVYSLTKPDRKAVKRQYIHWREDRDIPDRCDNLNCQFSQAALVWNGQVLPLILDHVNGNSYDNRVENLRLLCPNCDSQLTTRGGKNRGRIRNRREQSYEMWVSKGQVDALVLPKGQGVGASVGKPISNGQSGRPKGGRR